MIDAALQVQKLPPESPGTRDARYGYVAGSFLAFLKTIAPRRQSILDFRF
ncbi:hypothetical protein IQ269_19915 [Tychonema sp. LEGE 07199]|nr:MULTISPECIES: hypothetical protein [unclassified Tychonema]MBE9123003.1 hypothetical protein [Tychonema sp. LEGE 07199]MBE9133620.1 hypothetical protein [Tychonema sp. LEGE 07196]